MSPRRRRLVAVTWDDAHGSTVQDHEPLLMVTVGWLLCRDKGGVSIANERQADGQYRGHTFILAENVRKIKTIPSEGL